MTNRRDPYDYLSDLQIARHQPELWKLADPAPVDAPARKAAYELAVALGQCRLFHVEAGEWDGILPARVALEAAGHLADELERQWIDDAVRLDEDWDEADSADEAEDVCLDICERRMEATALWIACVETCEDYEATGEEPVLMDAVRAALETVRERLAEFDATVEQHLSLLESVLQRPSFEAWRECLSDEFYYSVAPWITRLVDLPPPVVEDDPESIVEPVQQFSRLQKTLSAIQPKTTQNASPPEQSPALPPLKWVSPDGRFAAWLLIPKECDSTSPSPLIMKLRHNNQPRQGQPVTPNDLGGEIVMIRLGLAKSGLSDQGLAEFLLADLKNGSNRDELQVCVDGLSVDVWTLIQ